MAFENDNNSIALSPQFIENIQNDFKNLSLESKKKYPMIKEACEEAIAKLKMISIQPPASFYKIINQIIRPLSQGCETKDVKLVKHSLEIVQKLITNQLINEKCASSVTDILWILTESGIEEVKILQTVSLLLTTNTVVHGETLARILVMCFRLHFTKSSINATVRHLVYLVFERVGKFEDSEDPFVTDAYLLFQDLIQLVNGDKPYWLIGLMEMPKTFGLELLESVLTQFQIVFYKSAKFNFVLKERVCALIIKLFSSKLQLYFPITVRLLRIVSILIQKYHNLLVTECEILLSLIVKFLDPDKPSWQRALALEVLHKMTIQPELLNSFCECYDLNDHTASSFQDIVNSLGAYVQSLFVNQQLQITGGLPCQTGFLLRGVWLPVTTFSIGQTKSIYLDMLDKTEPPSIPDGYGISIAYAAVLEIIRSLQISIKNPKLQCQLINSSWCGLLAALNLLIDASTDELITENMLKAIQTYTSLCGELELQSPRDAFITCICKSALPPHYALTVLNTVTFGVTQIVQYDESDFRQQAVAVGTPLPTSAGTPQGSVALTSKNLQSMCALISLAQCHGSILGTSWYLVLTTLQHLVWILGLKPDTGGSLRADVNAVIATSVMADLPVVSSMLNRLFESSLFLNDIALHHLVNALCKLSQEAMELAYSNREPSLFPVAKLLEIGLVNMSRIETLWLPLTNHLLQVCQHPYMRMREWGAEAATSLVKSSLQYKHHTVPLKNNQKLQMLLLAPLCELSKVPHWDVRQNQLECVKHILHTSGETLSFGWPLILEIIGAIKDQHGDNLIRNAFQCLQLIITDYLPVLPWRYLPLCLDIVAKFGSQKQELNICLTAVELIWNISDYFHQNQNQFLLIEDDFPLNSFDKLWMYLYNRLGELCVDSRQSLRKSACQTLFSTISAYGDHLKEQVILWQILFPLLDTVKNLSNSASNEKVDGGNILMHHSRNTAQKQWAETQVLTLSGVARVFNTKRQLLQSDCPRVWSLLLTYIENAALNKNNEISIAALKSFQEILCPTQNLEEVEMAWCVWIKIGGEITNNCSSQGCLTIFVQIFLKIFQCYKSKFNLDDLKQLGIVFTNAVSVPVGHGEITISISDSGLTPLQDGVLYTMEVLQKTCNNSKMILELFQILLNFAKLSIKQQQFHWIAFSEKSIEITVKLYEKTADNCDVIRFNILYDIIVVLHVALKYSSIWKISSKALLTVLNIGLKIARTHKNELWDELAATLNDFLFPTIYTPPDKDEAIDCKIIGLLKTEVLPYSNCIPKEFIMQVVIMLNKGSIHSVTNKTMELPLREEFAKICFETLLQFSLIDGDSKNLVVINNVISGQLAITSLIHRFHEVLKKFIDDEKLSGKCPLPRYRLSEISFVLKALTTLIVSMKTGMSVKVDNTAWEQLIELYPYLVEYTTTMSTQVSRPLREVLLQFYDLLHPPHNKYLMKISNSLS